jgi:hypothetical protein
MTHMHVQAPCSSSHHSTSAYQLHITTQHPLSTQPKSLYQTQQCFAHPSSRARAQLPLPVTSPHLPSEWQRELPAQDPQGLPDPLAGKSRLRFRSSVPSSSTDSTISDAFTKRESASEELFIRQEEKAKYVHLSDGVKT